MATLKRVSVSSALLSLIVSVPLAVVAQSIDSLELRAIRVIAEAELQSRHEVSGGVVSRAIQGPLHVRRVATLSGVELWRVQPRLSHTPSLLVGRIDTTLLRLAGFNAPELFALDQLVRPAKRDSADIVSAAKRYSSLADPNGGEQAVACPVGPTGEFQPLENAVAEWTPEKWWVVRVRRCSSDLVHVTPSDLVYVFRFDEDGRLLAWRGQKTSSGDWRDE